MRFNVVGPDDAVLAFGVEIEDARAKDPSYPWRFDFSRDQPPFLDPTIRTLPREGDSGSVRRQRALPLPVGYPRLRLLPARWTV